MPTTTLPSPAATEKQQIASRVEVHTFSPALAVVQATVTTATGIEQHLSLCMPAAPYGTAPWQLGAVALYLARLREAGEDPSAATLAGFLSEETPFAPQLWRHTGYGMHDPRATCLTDVLLGPRDASGWATASLLLSEGENGKRCRFNRVTGYQGAREILRAARRELEGEQQRIRAVAHRRRISSQAAEGLALEAQRAGELAARCTEALKTAHADAQHAGAELARSARRLPEKVSGPPLETIAGVLAAPVEVRRHAETGMPAARLQLRLDEEPTGRGDIPLPRLLFCTLYGDPALRAAEALRAGCRVVARGRRRYERYDGGARSAVSFDVVSIGPDLMA